MNNEALSVSNGAEGRKSSSTNHRFEDEWLVMAASSLPGVDGAKIDEIRGERTPFLSEALLAKGLARAPELAEVIKARFNISTERTLPAEIDRLVRSLIPESLCRRRAVVPLQISTEFIDVAMANPLDAAAITDIEAISGRTARPRFAFPKDMSDCLDRIFDQDSLVFGLLEKIGSVENVEVLGESPNEEKAENVRAPVIKLVNSILVQAIKRKASDIHIEHAEHESTVRYRIDGSLTSAMTLPRGLASGPVVARIKIMANLDMANRMRPQDGRAKLRIGSNEVGLRVSTLPTAFGEKVVLRILDKRTAQVPFENLGFVPEVIRELEKCLRAPQGILLVTGPTGSGKTTTLYSMLNKCRDVTTNIVSIEDPIEYQLEDINQVQVNEKQGLGFAAVLRAVLRQDPDVIMVGEIRDRETADIAFQAAMTGHLVFSTLHTNDTISTLSRLVDIGIERYKIAPGLLAITAQRLLRRLCASCRREVPADSQPSALGDAMRNAGLPVRRWKAVGCARCEGSGYIGRSAIIELLMVDEGLKTLINSSASEAEIRAAAIASGGLRPLARDILEHLSQGDVDLTEAAPYLFLDAPAKTKSPAPPEIPETSGACARKITIMTVDDDAGMRLLVSASLKSKNYDVIEASNGEEALAMLLENKPDLMLLDMKMPKMGGMEVIRNVRQSLGLTDLPILVLTAETDDVSHELALSLGADDYIAKPFKPGVVLARVGAALRRAGKLSWSSASGIKPEPQVSARARGGDE